MTSREETLLFSKKLPQKTYHDVVVAGGGVAGAAAAVSAAKRGKSVLLLEKTNILGGLATLGLVNFFVPMCNGRGKQIIFGLAEKWLRDSVRYGFDTLPESW
ncbi:MAG: FAD-dependent oxidoreductase, partial [Clostridia bacterium]|nr:FAD-dependent oxidoreductase [Clostridia bacterium]